MVDAPKGGMLRMYGLGGFDNFNGIHRQGTGGSKFID
jgi:hypothetical protein